MFQERGQDRMGIVTIYSQPGALDKESQWNQCVSSATVTKYIDSLKEGIGYILLENGNGFDFLCQISRCY